MRRAASVILFVIGGWMLVTEAMVAWMDLGEGVGAQLFMIGVFVPFAAVPMVLGTWASPGNRLSDLGLTLMLVAGVSALLGLMLLLTLNDPQVAKIMPPDQPMPDIAINPFFGGINLLLIAGGGFLLWRKGRARQRTKETELQRVFGD